MAIDIMCIETMQNKPALCVLKELRVGFQGGGAGFHTQLVDTLNRN